MMQVKEVCVRFTKMIIAVLFLPTLTCSKISELPYWGVHLTKTLVESTVVFSSLVRLTDFYNLTTMSVFLAFPNLLKNL